MSRTPSGASRSTAALAAALAVAVLATVVPSSGAAGAARGGDARAERAAVRAEQARVAAQVDALQGDQQAVTSALAALDEHVRGQEALLADARRSADASAAEAARAEAAAAEAAAELEELRAAMARYAVEAYLDPPGDELMRRFEAGSAQEDARRSAFLDLRSGRDVDLADQLGAVRQRLDDERRRAEEAAARAEAQAAEAERALGSLTAAKAEQAAFAEQVRLRLDERLSDAAHLARVDADLGRTIAAEEAALAAAVAKVPAPSPAGGSPGGGGSSGSGGGSGSSGGGGRRPALVTVGGITVAASVGDQLRALLGAASADGITFGGYGYRGSGNQVALRYRNCGSSDYAVYEMPPDQCSPPTARPGASLHERGLAIDFTVDGEFLKSRSHPGFVWLAANAGRFGFANLPSEPWHWSTTGG